MSDLEHFFFFQGGGGGPFPFNSNAVLFPPPCNEERPQRLQVAFSNSHLTKIETPPNSLEFALFFPSTLVFSDKPHLFFPAHLSRQAIRCFFSFSAERPTLFVPPPLVGRSCRHPLFRDGFELHLLNGTRPFSFLIAAPSDFAELPKIPFFPNSSPNYFPVPNKSTTFFLLELFWPAPFPAFFPSPKVFSFPRYNFLSFPTPPPFPSCWFFFFFSSLLALFSPDPIPFLRLSLLASFETMRNFFLNRFIFF